LISACQAVSCSAEGGGGWIDMGIASLMGTAYPPRTWFPPSFPQLCRFMAA
jgi:hypothetical protein